MARAYSDDLRCKVLQAYERSGVGLEDLAEQFGVSYGFTKKIRRQQLSSGCMERRVQGRHGPPSRVTEAVRTHLREQVHAYPDLTLAELKQGLEHSLQVHLSRTRLWDELRQLGLRRKKNAARQGAG
jgi:transposase